MDYSQNVFLERIYVYERGRLHMSELTLSMTVRITRRRKNRRLRIITTAGLMAIQRECEFHVLQISQCIFCVIDHIRCFLIKSALEK